MKRLISLNIISPAKTTLVRLFEYYTLTSPSSQAPAWAKAVIIGALRYFILPFDAIPDIIPDKIFVLLYLLKPDFLAR